MGGTGVTSRLGFPLKVLPWVLLSVAATALTLRQRTEIDGLVFELARRSPYSFPEKFRFETPYFGMVYAGEAGSLVDNAILEYGAFEKPELFILRKIAGQQKNSVFLDVGANTGTHSLFMSQLVETVHAIEPFPPILARLRHNIEINRLKNVVVHPVGFGKEKGSLPFFTPPDTNLAMGSFSGEFSKMWRGDGRDSPPTLQLPIEIGDQYLRQQGIQRVDICKIDIEGYEKFALQGLAETLRAYRPYVLMELNTTNPEGFHSLQELESAFPSHYRFYQPVVQRADLLDGTYKMKPLSHLPARQTNILAVPEERAVPE